MVTTAEIPVIDISATDVDQNVIARQLVEAAEEHGFIYIRNLGKDISPQDIDGAFALVYTIWNLTPLRLCNISHTFNTSPGRHSSVPSSRSKHALSKPTTAGGQACTQKHSTPRIREYVTYNLLVTFNFNTLTRSETSRSKPFRCQPGFHTHAECTGLSTLANSSMAKLNSHFPMLYCLMSHRSVHFTTHAVTSAKKYSISSALVLM